MDNEYEKLLGWFGKIKPLDDSGFISVEDHLKAIKKKDKEIKEKTRDINNIKKNLLDAQKAQLKTKLPQFKKSLSDFKTLLETNQREGVLHNFLKENFWIFGPQYVSVKNEPQIGFKSRGDFLLERIDNYYDIVELKTNKPKIFSRNKLSAEAKNAISQMIQYLHKCDILYPINLSELRLNILKPFGIIIMGLSDKETIENLRIHNAYFNNMKIMTYDQLINDAQQMINQFEKK